MCKVYISTSKRSKVENDICYNVGLLLCVAIVYDVIVKLFDLVENIQRIKALKYRIIKSSCRVAIKLQGHVVCLQTITVGVCAWTILSGHLLLQDREEEYVVSPPPVSSALAEVTHKAEASSFQWRLLAG